MAKTAEKTVEVLMSFDTTGSMYPCLTQVRRNMKEMVTRLFKEIPDIRIGVIAHGDYVDAGSTYVTKHLDLSDNKEAIYKFIENVGPTGGGDAPECYELVLHEARSLSWSAGASKALVLIGDDVPHGPNEAQNKKKLDWRNELGLLLEADIKVYGVQCLNRRHATPFYEEVAKRTGGFHLSLDQFSHVIDTIMAIVYNEDGGQARVEQFEKEVVASGRMSRSLDAIFGKLLPARDAKGRFLKADVNAVSPGRFQILDVDKDIRIDNFVASEGLIFERGRGFYEFMKTETIQAGKEIVLQDKATGDLFNGDYAYQLLGITKGLNARVKPADFGKWRVFVQSTSLNRNLKANTKFLYEVK